VLEAEITIKGEKPLGSHLLTAMYFAPEAQYARWTAVTLTKGSSANRNNATDPGDVAEEPDSLVMADKTEPDASTVSEALSRIEIPFDLRERINTMLTPGSSLAISNDGVSRGTGALDTDFIVLMQ